jgi:cobalt-zinc-cadmium resistance protein CzcA
VEALPKNNANVGAGYIEKNGEQYLIRAPGQVAISRRSRSMIIRTARRADPHQPTWPRWAGQATAHRRGHARRQESGAGYRLHAARRATAARYRQAVAAKLAAMNRSLPGRDRQAGV